MDGYESVAMKGSWLVSKTYRALAVVAVVATLLSVASQLWLTHVSVNGWFSYAPIGGPDFLGLPAGLLLAIWQPTTTLAAPVVSAFGIIVAAQARRWGWLVAFILLGLIAIYGPIPLLLLEAYGHLSRSLRVIGLDTVAPQVLPLALPGIAALIFVASARPRQPVEGIERMALP
jgi:hypothetical protein